MIATASRPKRDSPKLKPGQRQEIECPGNITITFSIPGKEKRRRQAQKSLGRTSGSDEVVSVSRITDSSEPNQDKNYSSRTFAEFGGIIEPVELFSGIVDSSLAIVSVSKKKFVNNGTSRIRIYTTLRAQEGVFGREKDKATLCRLPEKIWQQVWGLFNRGVYNLGRLSRIQDDDDFVMLTLTSDPSADTPSTLISCRYDEPYLSVSKQ